MKKILLSLFVLIFLGFGSVQVTYAAGLGATCATNDDCDGSWICDASKHCAVDPQLDAPAASTAAPAPTGGTPSSGATNGFVSLTQIPVLNQAGNSNSLTTFFNNVYKISIGIAAVLAVLQIMRAGVMYMGGDSITEKKAARSLIVQALLGLLLVLSPTIVFGIINPKILNLQIGNLDSLKVGSGSPTGATQVDTTGSPNPSVTAAICAAHPQTRPEVLQTNQTCAEVAGPTYALIDSQCCPGLAANGSCCAVDSNNVANQQAAQTAAANAGSGTFNYTLDNKDTNYNTGGSCRISNTSKNYPTATACSTDMTHFAGRAGYVLTRACDGSYPNTPTATWNAIKNLPVCPP